MPITFDITTDRLYNRGRREGIREGIREGKIEVARLMAEAGEPTERIARLTGLIIPKVEELTNRNKL